MGAASQFLVLPVPGMHTAAVGLCTQEHIHPLCTTGIPNPALPVPGDKGGSHAIQCVFFFTFLILSEDLVTFPTPMIIIISKFYPGHDAA